MARLTDTSTPKGKSNMSRCKFQNRLKSLLLGCAVGTALLSPQALAQQVDSNKLLELMVNKGLVSREEADAMIEEARKAPLPPVPAGGVAEDGTQTITYVPQVVRDQIKQELRTELGEQAQAQGWAKPGETPEWTRRIAIYGDVRMRGEGHFFDAPVYDKAGLQIGGNYLDFVDWARINGGDGFQSNQTAPGYVKPPYLNTAEDRRRFQLRARFGLKVQVADGIAADIRVATGNNNSPVSTNQTLGGDGGGKYHLWLDRASLRLTPLKDVTIDIGRFDNPFWTSDLLFDSDLNFDGVAISASAPVADDLRLFGTAGAFPVYNTSFNFGSRNVAGSFPSKDKYLFAAQAGIDFRPAEDIRLRLAGAYYYFDGLQGQFSSPCAWDQETCDTDPTRPAFQQFGNTMFALRNITPDPNVPPGASPEVQYFGLASKFELYSARGEVEYDLTDRIGLRLDGDYVKNLAFDRRAIAPLALNNFAPVIGTEGGQYDGGDTGWQARLLVGRLNLGTGQGSWSAERGDWSFHLGYRRLGSDAVVDGFADSDFALGGTNAKGWFAGANYAIARNSFLGLRWLSSDEISGPPLSVDRLIVDLSTRF